MLIPKQKVKLQKVKKLFICITKSNWGGAQKYVFDISTNTPRDQFDTTVLLGEGGDLKNKLEESGVKTVLLKNSQRDINFIKEIKLAFELFKIFKKERPDIIHLNSSKMSLGALVGRLLGIKKIIFTAHGWAFNEDRNILSRFVIKLIHLLTIFLCHKTIAVSEKTKKQICFPLNKKIVVIRNGLREIVFKNRDFARDEITIKILQKNPRAKSTLIKNPKWIGTISELNNNKGLSYAINAMSKININSIFIIIGEGEKRNDLEETIIKLGLSNRVFLIGKIDYASSYLKAFDIFTLTSITEALPYVLLEAGAASLPVVASDVGGIPEIIENDKTGFLVAPRILEEIKNSIELLIKYPLKAKYLGDSLNEKILKNFNQKNMLEKTFALYKNML